jgi:predicted phosphodiesterase|tara:strand:+ start:8310 stop:8972 length:663 start_codon:yes stop_codon:yes gene_type:complete
MKILFYGDPHKKYDPLFEAIERGRPDHVICVGDFELEIPLRETLRPIFESGIPFWYIMGNHDTDTHEQHDLLIEGYPEGNLGNRVVDLGGVRIAGLGGVFRGKVWYPKEGTEEPKWHSPEAYIAKNARWRDWLPRNHRDTIFPSYVEELGKQKCDILVTHEAASTLEQGFLVIDQLAERLGARIIVHGHLHHIYEDRTAGGVRARGLGLAEPWLLDTDDL